MEKEAKMDKDLQAHREALQGLVTSLGRDDIAVGEVSRVDGRLAFTLTRGEHTHRDEISIDILSDRQRAMAALMAIIPKISKAVEEKHLEASSGTSGS
ncbi:MAG: hypothetical protein ACRDF6_13960 [bacterium]